jgi:hypothetical protein
MTPFSTPDEFPSSGFFIVYETVSNTLKELSIFEVDGDWVKCHDTVMTQYFDDGVELEAMEDRDMHLTRYYSEFYIETFYHDANLHYALTEDELVDHVIIKSI